MEAASLAIKTQLIEFFGQLWVTSDQGRVHFVDAGKLLVTGVQTVVVRLVYRWIRGDWRQ